MNINLFNKHSLRSHIFLLTIPLALSIYTHLWNPIGFLIPEHDESIYIRRAMHVLEDQGLQDPASGYDHPYFGQLFLAGALGAIGYPQSLHTYADGDVHSIEILWIIPRLLMAVLAVIDTFLIYKISKSRYNRNIALIASILFAVMPITWLLRRVWLDSILLPFLLSSILFALYAKDAGKSISKNNNIPLILLSGIFLGLAIFTKIPAFTMIPLVGFLIYTTGSNKRNWKTLGIWFIPVILIPLIWPAYAFSVGQFNQWIAGVYHQTHRIGGSLFSSIKYNFDTDPILLALGTGGLVYAAIKRDFFLLLWALPFITFSYFIVWTQFFHFILIFPTFCIASSNLIVDLSNKFRNKNVQQILPFAIISTIGIFGLVSTSTMITGNFTTRYFEASAFIVHYLQNSTHYDNYNNFVKTDIGNKLTVISNPFYLWIPQYVFHLDHDYVGHLSVDTVKTQKVVLIVDVGFRRAMFYNTEAGDRLGKIYKSYDKKMIAAFDDITIFLSDLLHPSPQISQVNLLDNNHLWRPFNDALLNQKDGILAIKVHTNNTNELYNRAVLDTQINSTTMEPLILTLDYSSQSLNGDATFLADIRDDTNRKILWSTQLNNTIGQSTAETFFLPRNITNKPIELRVYVATQSAGEHSLTLSNMSIT